MTDCERCHGEGVLWNQPHVKRESPVAPGLMVWQPPQCPTCEGTGLSEGDDE